MRNNYPRSFRFCIRCKVDKMFLVMFKRVQKNVAVGNCLCLKLLMSSLGDNVTVLFTPITATFTFFTGNIQLIFFKLNISLVSGLPKIRCRCTYAKCMGKIAFKIFFFHKYLLKPNISFQLWKWLFDN